MIDKKNATRLIYFFILTDTLRPGTGKFILKNAADYRIITIHPIFEEIFMPNHCVRTSRSSSRITLYLRITVTALAFAWLLFSVDWHDVSGHFTGIRWIRVGLALVLYLSFVVPCAIRWQITSRISGFTLRFGDAAYWYLAGDFFNSFLPTGHGGDVVRAAIVARRYSRPIGNVMAGILLERLIGIAVSILVVIIILVWNPISFAYRDQILMTAVFFLCCGTVVVLSSYIPAVHRFFSRLIRAIPWQPAAIMLSDLFSVLDTARHNYLRLSSAGILSLVNQLFMIVSAIVLASAIPGFETTWHTFFVVIPLIFFAVLIPSVGGYGVAEAGYVVFFGWFGVHSEPAIVFAITKLLFSLIVAFTGGLLFCIGFSNEKKVA